MAPTEAPPTQVLTNSKGVEIHVLAAGAAIQRVLLPDSNNTVADVVLGFDDVKPYVDGSNPYFGVIIGRCANRIADATFTLDGQRHSLTANDPPNSLHGGSHGWGEQIWEAEATVVEGHPAVRLKYHSPSGDQGYPGNVRASVLYVLSDGPEGATGRLRCLLSATTDTPTPISMVQHSVWNLRGHDAGTVLDHTLSVSADQFTPVDARAIPTGQLADVVGTAMDFREPQPIGARIKDAPGGGGYDHNFVLRGGSPSSSDRLHLAAELWDPSSGRRLRVSTNQPGLQVYSANFLDGSVAGKSGTAYAQHAGVALETQAFPNSINTPSFPSVVIRPGDTYDHEVVFDFSN